VSSYRFDDYLLDVDRQLLVAGQRVIPLPPKVFGILNCLVRAAGTTVTKEELISEVWHHDDVSDATIVQHVWNLRKLLDERVRAHKYILTVPGRGYRFVPHVTHDADLYAASSGASAGGAVPAGEPALWRHYFIGCKLGEKRDLASLRLGLQHFNSALALDSTFAPAWAGIAGTYSNLAFYAFVRWEQILPLAQHAIAKAVHLDRTSSFSHCLLAQIRLAEWDVEGAERALDTAGNLDGGSPAVHQLSAFMAAWRGEFEPAIAHAKRAVAAAPGDIAAHGVFAGALATQGDLQNAIASYTKILEVDPACRIARQGRCEAYVGNGQFDLALRDLELLPKSPSNVSRLACIEAFVGNRSEASRIFFELQKRSAVEYVEPHCLAQVHIALGRYDEAMRLTEEALASHDLAFAAMANSPLLGHAAKDRPLGQLLGDVREYLCKPRRKIS
jgi:DNA-binding winged helix-turn-helix (wHTH) protein/tetratricopeptide (TPR) repeat protein